MKTFRQLLKEAKCIVDNHPELIDAYVIADVGSSGATYTDIYLFGGTVHQYNIDMGDINENMLDKPIVRIALD